MMGSAIRIILLGLLIWAVPFGLGMVIFPVVPPVSALFDTIMVVTLAGTTAIASVIHVSRLKEASLDDGLRAGSIWMLMSLLCDVPFFILGPEMTRMDPVDYMADVGLSYIMIPLIAGAVAAVRRA
jgi:hypothetical protein